MESRSKSAVAGTVLLLPALMVVSFGLLQIHFNAHALWVHPVLVMGGLFVALLLNAGAVLRFAVARDQEGLVGTFAVRVRGGGVHLAIFTIGLVLLAALAAYLFVENFQPRPI